MNSTTDLSTVPSEVLVLEWHRLSSLEPLPLGQRQDMARIEVELLGRCWDAPTRERSA